jgi:EAL domain-containing protein (putative c-di-GMP-specific phosphodiesterase class I)
MGSALSDRATEAARPGVALQPVIDLIDGVDLGYEALPRPDGVASDAVIVSAIALAQHTGPAVLLVPLSRDVLSAPDFSVAAAAQAMAVNPGELAWIVRTEADGELDELSMARLRELRERGYLLAVDGVVHPTRDGRLIADLRAEFVFLDAAVPARLADSEVARADLAAAVVFVARLGGRIVARGIDSKATAAAVAEVGVQYGVGPHLARPLVIDAALAEPSDEVVPVAWFQRREVRVFRERGDTLRAPIELMAIPEGGSPGLDDRSFARFLVEAARTLQAEHDPERILQVAAARLAQVISVDRLAIFEADWERHRLRPRVLSGAGTEGLIDGEISLSEGITGWTFARGQPYRCGDTDSHPAAATIPGTQREPESMLAIPLSGGG